MPAEVRIGCQQLLLDDSSVFSVQSCEFPLHMARHLTTDLLLGHYLAHIRRCTAGIVRSHVAAGAVEFRLIGDSRSLISFLLPRVEGNALVLDITGGMLVQPDQPGGKLCLAIEHCDDAVRVALRLSGFRPLLLGAPPPGFFRYWFYRLTQAYIHRRVTVGFLAGLYRQLGGETRTVRIVPLKERKGRPV